MRDLLLKALGRVTTTLKATPLVNLKLAKRAYYWLYSVLRPDGVRCIQVEGARLLVDPADEGLASFLLTAGTYEAFQTGLMRRVLRPGDSAVDIGANIGYHSVLMGLAVAPSGHVYSVEPCADNHDLLCRNVELNGLGEVVLPKLCAAGTKAGKARLAHHPSSSGGHSLALEAFGASTGFEEVEVVTIDSLVPPGRRVSVAKLDAQGSELNALLGMSRVIEESPDIHIFMEFWPAALLSCGSDPPALVEHLLDLGLKPYEICATRGTLAPLGPGPLRALAASQKEYNLLLVRNPDHSPVLSAPTA